MMTKAFEIRDRGTMIPVIATKIAPSNKSERSLMRKSGLDPYATPDNQRVVVYRLSNTLGDCRIDPWLWPGESRTMRIGHIYIKNYFDTLISGSVVDVEYILGETDSEKLSEMIESC